MQQRSFFPHESLRAYQQAVAVSRWVSSTKFPVGMAWLRDQTQRSAGSVVLNIAEGRGRTGRARRNHYQIAYASAAEACAALALLDLPGATEQQQALRGIGAMLAGLMR